MSDPDITVTPVYRSAVNAVTKPTSLAGISRYVVEKWLPELGGDGLAILAFLRKKCFYNRETGERRETVRCKLSDIASGCGMSSSTVRRQLQSNAALRQFVGINEEFELDPKRGGLYRVENSYTVAMDDPIHPSDMELLQEEIRRIRIASEKGAEDPKERARRRAQERPAPTPSQIGRALDTQEKQRPSNLEGGPLNLEGGPSNLEGPPFQIERTLNKESLSSYILLNTPDPAALPGDSLSLFPEKDAAAPQVTIGNALNTYQTSTLMPFEEERPAWKLAYAALPDRARETWTARAKEEALAHGLKPSNIPAIVKLARELFRQQFEGETSYEDDAEEIRHLAWKSLGLE